MNIFLILTINILIADYNNYIKFLIDKLHPMANAHFDGQT